MAEEVITDRYHFNLLLPQLVTVCGLSLAGVCVFFGSPGWVAVEMVAVTGDDYA
jgi:hypothetical protein